MKALFNFLQSRITTKVPAIKTVRMWNGQTSRERDSKNENPVKFPALFIEFIANGEVQNLSLRIKNVPLIVRCRFALEGYKFTRLTDLDFQDTFDSFIQGFRGNETDSVQFSTLQEQMVELDENFDQVNEPYIDYSTIYRKKTAYERSTDFVTPPNVVGPATSVDITNDI